MGKLICDFPEHKGTEVIVDSAAFAKIQQAVKAHLGNRAMSALRVTDQRTPDWHITPNGPDWHIGPSG